MKAILRSESVATVPTLKHIRDLEGGGFGSVVKSTYYSYRGHGFTSQHSHGDL